MTLRGARAASATSEDIASPQLRVITISPEIVEATEALRAPARPVVGIVGLGYVGLPTALGFASDGVNIIGYDINASRLERIEARDVDLVPEDHVRLQALLGRPELALTTEIDRLSEADTVIVCVPTPVEPCLSPDLRPIKEACAAVVEAAVPGQTIILTSTSYVGCTRDLVVHGLAGRGLEPGKDVFVAFSPERIDPGNIVHPQRTVTRVVGGLNHESACRAAEIISRIAPVHMVGSLEAAEMTKLLENTFRAVNIAMINEFATAAAALDVDIAEVISAAATKPYGFMPFYPGPGVGGHCIPCDPHYLLWQLRTARVPMPLVSQAMISIAERPGHVVRRVGEVLSDRGLGLRGARVIVVGVTYKGGVADLRESSAIEILERLVRAGARVEYADPMIPSLRLPDGTRLVANDKPAGANYDLVLIHTIHPSVDLDWVAECHSVLDATYRLPAQRRTAVV